MTDRICVGAIAGSYGVNGEVRLKSFCAEAAAIADYGPLSTEDGGRSFEVTLTRPVKGGFAARLSGVTSREQAEALRGTRLFAPRARLPDPEEDEFYHADLIGMAIVDTGGTEIGSVKAVLNHGATDLLEVHVKGGSDTALIPFTRDIVPTVDLSARRIVVDPPEGLLE